MCRPSSDGLVSGRNATLSAPWYSVGNFTMVFVVIQVALVSEWLSFIGEDVNVLLRMIF